MLNLKPQDNEVEGDESDDDSASTVPTEEVLRVSDEKMYPGMVFFKVLCVKTKKYEVINISRCKAYLQRVCGYVLQHCLSPPCHKGMPVRLA